MKLIITFLLFIGFLCANELSGKYKYKIYRDGSLHKGGSIQLEKIADKKYHFNMSLYRGAPSYNSGELQGEIIIENSRGVFFEQSKYNKENICEWEITFMPNIAKIKTLNSNTSCGFGHAIWVDGRYMKIDKVKSK